MNELPAFLEMMKGSGLGYLLAAVCVIGLLTLRRLTVDPSLRRRAIVGVLLFLLFAVLRFPLVFIDPTQVNLRGETVPNPPYQVLNVLSLIVFALALIQSLTLLLVQFMLVKRLGVTIPGVVADVALIAVFLISALLIVYYETDLNITGLFTTAGVVSIVIGLALQDTLGNIFSGLALEMEQPFKAGDWVSWGDFEGVVIDVGWRSTQFRTRNNDLVTVPNSTLSKESFINHSTPSRISGRTVEIGVHYRHPPAVVKRVLLEACREVDEVLDKPQPLCRLKDFGDFAITYQVKFWIKDFAAVLDIEESYRTVVWYAFQRHGIEIPFPIQTEIQVQPPEEEVQKAAAVEDVLERLRDVEFLSPLSEEELRTLAKRTKLHDYYTNETICRQGDEGDSFFLIHDGEVVVSVSRNGREQEVARLTPPSFFGEMALCTGEPRSATVRALKPVRLLVIDRDIFKSIIYANPDLATEMSHLLAKRHAELGDKRAMLDRSLQASHDETSRQILRRIRDFFGFQSSEPQRSP